MKTFPQVRFQLCLYSNTGYPWASSGSRVIVYSQPDSVLPVGDILIPASEVPPLSTVTIDALVSYSGYTRTTFLYIFCFSACILLTNVNCSTPKPQRCLLIIQNACIFVV